MLECLGLCLVSGNYMSYSFYIILGDSKVLEDNSESTLDKTATINTYRYCISIAQYSANGYRYL